MRTKVEVNGLQSERGPALGRCRCRKASSSQEEVDRRLQLITYRLIPGPDGRGPRKISARWVWVVNDSVVVVRGGGRGGGDPSVFRSSELGILPRTGYIKLALLTTLPHMRASLAT
jgi:hypothetical protein